MAFVFDKDGISEEELDRLIAEHEELELLFSFYDHPIGTRIAHPNALPSEMEDAFKRGYSHIQFVIPEGIVTIGFAGFARAVQVTLV